jgi:hypothetical protein
MRILILSTLLASVALPSAAVAGPDDQQRRRHARATAGDSGDSQQRQRPGRSNSSDDDSGQRPVRASSASNEQRRERPAWAQGRGGMSDNSTTASTAQRSEGSRFGWRSRAGGSHGSSSGPSVGDSANVTTPTLPENTTVRSGDGGFGERAREFRRRRGVDSAGGTNTTTVPTGTTTARHRDDGRRWSGSWRNDRRYDWNRYRDRHRSIFRLGFYFDPYGSSYRRHSIGWSMWPNYYQSNYWLDDPWMYRLPPAYGPYRWVRYWDDALLVNIYTGEVVDVIHSFFW